MNPSRGESGWTLIEVITVSVILGVAAVAFIAIPQLGRDRATVMETAASIDAVMTSATALWRANGEVTNDIDMLRDVYPMVEYRDGVFPVGPTEVRDTVSYAALPGPSGTVGVAARSASGECLLARFDLGDGALPPRYAIVPAAGNTGCSGQVALTLNTRDDVPTDPAQPPGRDGASWASAIRLP